MAKVTNPEEKLYYKILGSILLKERLSKRISRSRLVSMLHEKGELEVTSSQIQKYENGHDRISDFRLRKICKVLEIDYKLILETVEC